MEVLYQNLMNLELNQIIMWVIGGTLNIAGIGILRKEGHEVANSDFFKIGILFTLSAIIPAYILVWILFGV